MNKKAYDFLDFIFRNKTDAQWLLLWTLQNKKSLWVNNLKDISNNGFQGLPENMDCYFGVGLAGSRGSESERCKANNIVAIPGLWLDIDISGGGHKGKKYVPDMKTGEKLIEKMGLEPSIIVSTGGGLHCYWLFEELCELTNTAERSEIKRLEMAWNSTAQQRAEDLGGFTVDSVHDLSRVLRIPGTWNLKSGDKKPVEVVSIIKDRLYSPSDFENYLISGTHTDTTLPLIANDIQSEFILDAKAQPPFEKWDMLQDVEPNARLSFNHSRKDMKDGSNSAYDMSLACIALQYQWTDQEIINLLIAHRRKHNADLKLRFGYYDSTLKNAKLFVRKNSSIESLQKIQEEVVATGVVPEGSKEKLLANLSVQLLPDGIEITRIIKFLTDPPSYQVQTTRGEILLQDVGDLIGQAPFRRAIAAATGIYLKTIKGKDWEIIAQSLLDACDEIKVSSESTLKGSIKAWVNEYLENYPPVLSKDEAVVMKMPFRLDDDRIAIFGRSLKHWLKISQHENISDKRLGTLLKMIECEQKIIPITIDGKPSSRCVWVVK